jgi:hypothetical protein
MYVNGTASLDTMTEWPYGTLLWLGGRGLLGVVSLFFLYFFYLSGLWQLNCRDELTSFFLTIEESPLNLSPYGGQARFCAQTTGRQNDDFIPNSPVHVYVNANRRLPSRCEEVKLVVEWVN